MPKQITKAQLLASVSLIIVLIIDFYTPLGVAVGVLYAVAFYFVSKEPVKIILIFSVITILLIALKLTYFINKDISWIVYCNRLLSIAAITIFSFIAIKHRQLHEKRQKEREHYINLLKKKNSKLRIYQQSINVHLLVTVTDSNGVIKFVNEPYCRISKYSRNELIGQTHSLVKSGEHPQKFYEDMWQTIKQGASWRGEIKSRTKDDLFFWSDTAILPVKDSYGNIVEYFALSLPITERKLLEKEQAENLEAFETIVWKVSHKLRAPISTCMGITQLLEKEIDSNSKALHVKAVEHRKHCTSELDEFSREITALINKKAHAKKNTDSSNTLKQSDNNPYS